MLCEFKFSFNIGFVLIAYSKRFFSGKVVHPFLKFFINKGTVFFIGGLVVMYIPETPGLLCEAIAGKPGKLIIAGIIKAAHTPGYGIV